MSQISLKHLGTSSNFWSTSLSSKISFWLVDRILGEGQKHSTKGLRKMGTISSEGEKIPYGKIEQRKP
jgi:hypothetical protein